MPSIAGNRSARFTAAVECKDQNEPGVHSSGESTPGKRRLRSDSAQEAGLIKMTPPPCSPMKWKSPRRCTNGSPNGPANGIEKETGENGTYPGEFLARKLSSGFLEKPKWNPNDLEQLSIVKEALHISSAPSISSMVVCREDEQKMILDFCKQCIEHDNAGSLYVCGCPGTGKSLSMQRIHESLMDWTNEAGFQPPDVFAINCTSLTNTSEIFQKMLGENQPRKRTNNGTSPLQRLQRIYSQGQQSSGRKMMLIIADELDYLITKDCAVLHDLFMLTTLPFSRCVLIGIANAIDLADRFLPRLRSMNCKPMVITFRAYTKDQIIKILQRRLMGLPYTVFQPQALELCARRVAAASGDMRRALCICRSAIEILEAELRQSTHNMELLSGCSDLLKITAYDQIKQETDIVRVDHMAIALSKTYKSPIVDTVQSLPQHQQIILCSAVKLFRNGKKDTTMGELCKSYIDICKSMLIPPVGTMELSSMCRVLSDQGLLKLGQSRQDKLARVTLKVDEADIVFALQGVRLFRNCLQ